MTRIIAASWGQAVAAALLFLSLRFYTGAMAPEAFGLAMLGQGAILLIDGLGAMAFVQVLAQQLKDLDRLPARVGIALGLALPFTAWLALLSLPALVLAWVWLGKEGMLLTAIGIAAWLASEGLRNAGQVMAQLDRRLMLVSTWAAVEALAIVACSLLVLRYTDGHPAALILGMLLGRAGVAFVMAPVALGRPQLWRPDLAAARAAWPQAARLGWQVALMTPLGWISVFADRYIVGATTGLTEAGVFAALAGAVVRPYAIVSSGLANLYRPDFLDEAAGRPPQHAHPMRAWVRTALVTGLGGVAGIVLLGPTLADFLIRFPTEGQNTAAMMAIIAASQVLLLMTHACDNRMLAHGRSQIMLISQVVVLVLGLPLIALGASWLGVVGAALGRFANEGLKLGATWAVMTYTLGRLQPRPDSPPSH